MTAHVVLEQTRKGSSAGAQCARADLPPADAGDAGLRRRDFPDSSAGSLISSCSPTDRTAPRSAIRCCPHAATSSTATARRWRAPSTPGRSPSIRASLLGDADELAARLAELMPERSAAEYQGAADVRQEFRLPAAARGPRAGQSGERAWRAGDRIRPRARTALSAIPACRAHSRLDRHGRPRRRRHGAGARRPSCWMLQAAAPRPLCRSTAGSRRRWRPSSAPPLPSTAPKARPGSSSTSRPAN